MRSVAARQGGRPRPAMQAWRVPGGRSPLYGGHPSYDSRGRVPVWERVVRQVTRGRSGPGSFHFGFIPRATLGEHFRGVEYPVLPQAALDDDLDVVRVGECVRHEAAIRHRVGLYAVTDLEVHLLAVGRPRDRPRDDLCAHLEPDFVEGGVRLNLRRQLRGSEEIHAGLLYPGDDEEGDPRDDYAGAKQEFAVRAHNGIQFLGLPESNSPPAPSQQGARPSEPSSPRSA